MLLHNQLQNAMLCAIVRSWMIIMMIISVHCSALLVCQTAYWIHIYLFILCWCLCMCVAGVRVESPSGNHLNCSEAANYRYNDHVLCLNNVYVCCFCCLHSFWAAKLQFHRQWNRKCVQNANRLTCDLTNSLIIENKLNNSLDFCNFIKLCGKFPLPFYFGIP